VRIQTHLTSGLHSVVSTFIVTAEFNKRPVSLFAHTHSHSHRTQAPTHNTEHTPSNQRMLYDAFSNSYRYHTRKEKRQVASFALVSGRMATRLDADSFWRMVMQPFRRIKIFCFFISPHPGLPTFVHLLNAPVCTIHTVTC
jgi:hypothetical protein